MNYIRKTWLPRLGTNLNKFLKSSETSASVILTNAPDAIEQAGTYFSADAMNNIEGAIEQGFKFDFTGLGQTIRQWQGICFDPSGNLYATVSPSGDIYKSTDHGVTFTALGLTARNWLRICSDPSGVLYATVNNGDIYKSIDHGVTFTALGLTTRAWVGICSDPSGVLYATVNTGDIYKSIDHGVTFTALGLTTRAWVGICSDPSGVLYAIVNNGDIYKSIDHGVTFTALGLATRDWVGICSDPSGALYATVTGGDIYKSIDHGVTFTALGLVIRDWRGIYSDPSGILCTTVNGGDIYKSSYIPISPSSVKAETITTADVTETDGRFSTFILSGALTGNRAFILPAEARKYTIINNCTGAYYVTVKTASGTGVIVNPGETVQVYCDSVNILRSADKAASLSETNDTTKTVKIKKLTGTTPSTQGSIGTIPHGISSLSKILSCSVFVSAVGEYFPPEFTYSPGYQYSAVPAGTGINIALSASSSANILSAPVIITILYEE